MNTIYKRMSKMRRALALCLAFFALSQPVNAQLNVTAYKTAAELTSALAGSGVTITNPVLTCAGAANGTFTVSAVSPIGIPAGIVLTTGSVIDTVTAFGTTTAGVANPESTGGAGFADAEWGLPGDAQLTALLDITSPGQVTNDACVLEFDFRPAGDTIRFNYVFGSEEYDGFTCTNFNDVFAFFISGGAYTSPTNLALVPGTSIPVCINSVNCGATGEGDISTCTSLGTGSPFCAYFVNNELTTVVSNPYIVYNGLTTLLGVVAAVNPCDTYHLKLAIADAGDDAYDSGVFLQGGSLTSNTTTGVTATGTSGLPYCIRSCAPGNFVFSTPVAQDTNIIIHYIITGTAVNGYDYATIPDSVVIPAGATSSILDINTTIVPAAGPKVITLEIEDEDPCHPGVFTIGALANLTILDSFSFHIATPDTTICLGQDVHIIAIGDSQFSDILSYTWAPNTTIDFDTSLTPTVTPPVTTTYVLTATTAAALGCAPESHSITITVLDPPALTVDSSLVNTCVGIPVQLHVYATDVSNSFTYLWTPSLGLSNTTIANPVVTPPLTGNTTYNIAVSLSALSSCTSNTTITVHTEPNNFILNNTDTAICLGDFVQASVTGSSAFSYAWTPSAGVSDTTIMNPTLTPPVATAPDSISYTVTATYAACPAMVHSFSIQVDTPASPIIFIDTICLGMSRAYDVTVPGDVVYTYLWTSSLGDPTYLSDNNIANPVATPGVTGAITYTATIAPPHVVGCANIDIAHLFVLPNTIDLATPDTAICKGNRVQVIATGDALFAYQWLPTAGIANSTLLSPVITPDTSATYVITASFHTCPDIHDTLRVDVAPRPEIYMGFNRAVCENDTLNIASTVSPMWYTHYTYTWSPATNLDNTTATSVIYTGTSTDTTELHLTVNTPVSLTTDTTCRAVDSIQIIVHPDTFEHTLPDVDLCPRQSIILVPASTDPSGVGATFHWYPSLYLSDSLGASPELSPITSQSYIGVATSIYGCKDTLSFDATVHPGALIEIGADSISLFGGETYQVSLETNCNSFSWFPPAGLSDPTISNPIASPGVSTQYVVTGTTLYGCVASDSINIYVDPSSVLSTPNAFAPGSGPNSDFKIIKRGVATLNYFRIFNRWGNTVFETNDIDKGWDGQYNGTPQPFGVYVYEIQAVTSDGKIFVKHGNITLIR